MLETQIGELNLSGLASDDQGVVRVEWSDGRGGQGVASGAFPFPWSVNGIALQPGLIGIEVIAFDAEGNAASDSLAVTYTIPAPQLGVSTGSNGELQLELSGTVGSICAIQTSANGCPSRP